MNILFLILIMIIIILIFMFCRSLNKNMLFTLFCSLLILQIIITPKLCIDSTIAGTKLYLYKVFPSLFSFLIISSFIINFDGIYIYSKLIGNILSRITKLPKECTFVLIISTLCGYPLGAKYSCDLYNEKIIDYKTCERLLNIASNASPLFVIGSVGVSMINNHYIGYLLLLSNYISCLAMSFILPASVKVKNTVNFKINTNYEWSNKNFGSIFKEAVDNSIKSCLSIGGFVILFSVINSIIKSNIIFDIATKKLSILLNLPSNIIQGILLGLIEMTNGCNLISSTNINMYYKVIIMSFLLGFGGLSIISQTYSFTYKYNFSMKKFITRKFIQGTICSVISAALYFVPFVNLSIQTFNSNSTINKDSIFMVSFLLLLLPMGFYKLKKLKAKYIRSL